jgi:TonB family protein
MKGDFLISFLLHFVLLIAVAVASPFKPKVNISLEDVIHVNLTAAPPSAKTITPEPIALPRPIEADEPLAALIETKSVREAKKVEKPKPKKEEPKPYQPEAEKGRKDSPGSEKGQKDVSENLGAGSKFGGASVDNVSFNYPYWFVQAFGKIERNWSNPVYANRPLTCTIYFQVIRSGRIIKVEIEGSSGVDAFDRACERAVKISEPLPPLPDDFTNEILGIHLEFPYVPN